MSDQPNITPATPAPPTAQSLDDILNQLEKATSSAPGSSAPTPAPTSTTMPEPSTAEAPPVPTEAAPVMPAEPESVAPVVPEAPAIDPATSSEPMAVVEPAPASEPEAVSSEPAPAVPEPEAAPTDPIPAMTEVSNNPVPETPPVATLAENDIPAPPPTAASEPAPMVKEEPGIDVGTASIPAEPAESSPEPVSEAPTSYTPEPMPQVEPAPTPQPEAMPDQPVPEATPSEAPKSSGGNSGKILAGVIGVLLLVGAVGAGVFLTQQNQETRSPAAGITQATPLPTVSADSANIIADSPKGKGKIVGMICTDKTKTPGVVYIYNLTRKTFSFQTIGQGQSAFTSLAPEGQVVLFYQADGSDVKVGYTDESHKLKSITVNNTTVAGGVALCDTEVDPSSAPTTGYVLAQ